MELNAQVTAPPPKIENYEDYRQFLTDFHQFKKSTHSSWSYRLFAARSGISSPNYLQLVMQGKRNLSEEKAAAVAKAMGLENAESSYFIALVRITNARSPEEEMQAYKEGLRSLRKLKTTEMTQAQSKILDEWYYMTIRGLVNLSDFEYSGSWVANKLYNLITEDQALDALLTLEKSGFIEQNKLGKWQACDPILDTGAEGYHKLKVNHYHKEVLKAFSKAIEIVDSPNREYGLLTLPIREAQMPELKRRVQQFQDEVIGWLQSEDSPDTLCNLGTYLIPIKDK